MTSTVTISNSTTEPTNPAKPHVAKNPASTAVAQGTQVQPLEDEFDEGFGLALGSSPELNGVCAPVPAAPTKPEIRPSTTLKEPPSDNNPDTPPPVASVSAAPTKAGWLRATTSTSYPEKPRSLQLLHSPPKPPANTIQQGLVGAFVDLSPEKDGKIRKTIHRLAPTGARGPPEDGNIVMLHVTVLVDGKKEDCTQVDTTGIKVTIGDTHFPKGLEMGIMSMKVGEACKLFVNSTFAFGDGGTGRVPQNQDLEFEVELLEIQDIKDANPEPSQMSPGERLKLSKSRHKEATKLELQENFAEAVSMFQLAAEAVKPTADSPVRELTSEERAAYDKSKSHACFCFIKLCNWEEAINAAKEALRVLREMSILKPKVYHYLGYAYMMGGDFMRSKENLWEAHRRAPGNEYIQTSIDKLKKAMEASIQE